MAAGEKRGLKRMERVGFYRCMLKSSPMKSVIYINADAGSRGNPGPSAIGIVIRDEEGKVLETYKECIGKATVNVAEYKALIKALELAMSHTRGEVNVSMDSELVLRQVRGVYCIKKAHLRPLFQQVKDNERAFEKVNYNEVPRENRFQEQADTLVNEALDLIEE